MADQPRGTIRLNVISAADGFLSGPALAGFLRSYPDVRVELMVSEAPTTSWRRATTRPCGRGISSTRT